MKIDMELKPSDIILLKLLACILIIFFTARFLIFPGIEKYQDLSSQKEDLQYQQEEMQQTIDTKPVIEKKIEKQKEVLDESAQGFYVKMENQQLDELITGLALKHNLFPVYLNIGETVPGVPAAYQVTESNGSDSSDTSNDTASDSEGSDTGSMLQYIYTAPVTVTLQGTETEIRALMDDVARNYPGIQIRTLDMQEQTYVNSDMQTVGQMNCNCEFAVYMYEENVTSGEENTSEN